MINASLISIYPDLVKQYLQMGCLHAAQKKNLLCAQAVDLRRFAVDKHGSVDGKPFGGDDGMVLRPEPLASAVTSVTGSKTVIYLNPQGKQWTAADACFWSRQNTHLVFVCGRFAGVDQRFIDTCVDYQYSIGDFIVSGGELPGLMILESIVRLIPGVLGNRRSSEIDSFTDGLNGGLEYPLYTRPRIFAGLSVPSQLLSGNEKLIQEWRAKAAKKSTTDKRPDLVSRLHR